jgi:septum formation protein
MKSLAIGGGGGSAGNTMISFILASGSPRRIALLRAAGFDFEIVSPAIEESHSEFLTPIELTLFNAFQKATAVANQHSGGVVLGADTVVALGSEIFGKPADIDDARRMLTRLVGKSHEVITGIALLNASRDQLIIRAVRTRVKFRSLSHSEIEAYLKIAEPLDKAGAYAAQDSPDLIIEKVTGSFSNVVGLPMEIVGPLLASAGVYPAVA